VEIKKRANGRSKFIIVDGLERIDADQHDAFVEEATRGGWQLIGTRVERGELVIERLQPEKAQAAE
jgi:hypothetical protein